MDLPASLIIGGFCGLLGTSFVWVNTTLGIYRKKYITKNWMKLFEAFFFAFLTATVFFGAALITSDKCVIINDADQADHDKFVSFLCPKGTYNELATIVFSTEGGIIRFLLKAPVMIRD